ncbi:hydroxyacid dehydrogenase [Anaerobacillus sp. MEB173]|uniref:hydroxyacid dehydrogenase n=1 Tax=Anaerobacillus sp. MEB173 TaxID=3383345 RepID=UPI003F917C75
MKVLITELIWSVGVERLKQFADVEYDPSLWSNRELLLEKVKDVDAIIVRNQTKVDHELLHSAKKLQAVGRLGVGLDNIDLSIAKNLNIKVVFARNANAISVAEYVMSAILEANRPLYLANQDVRQGNWDRKRFTGGELYGKTIGLVGAGEIAHRVAKRALAFGMRVIGYDPFLTEYDFAIAETGVELVTFEEVLLYSDYVSIHVPLTPATKGLFSTQEFKYMKNNAYIINTSRGGIIDEIALFEAATNHDIAGAFLDVLEEEPVNQSNPLLRCDNVVLTPHVAGLTEESQFRTSILVAEEVKKVLQGENALCVVK